MSNLTTGLASQLRDFINSGHIYTDELSEELLENIQATAEKEVEDNVSTNITRRKGKSRRSMGPQYPQEWAKSRESFRKAVLKFQGRNSTPSQDESLKNNSSKRALASPADNKRKPVLDDFEEISDQPRLIRTRTPKPADNFSISTVPKDITSLFHGIEKLDENNWYLWKGHMQDNLDLCDLWDIITGDEPRPSSSDTEQLKLWIRREKIARILIKNALGTKDYSQVRHARNVTELWNTLMSLHQ